LPRPNHTFSQVLTELRKLIVSSIQPGEALPSVRQLARTYGVAPDTIHRATKLLAKEKVVRIRSRIGCIRTPDADATRSKKSRSEPFRLGIISRRNEQEWQQSDMYERVFNEAERRKITVVRVPNPRRGRTTPGRSRAELMRVPWNSFDVGMLFEIEDAQTLSDPLLKRRNVLAVDQDATAYGLDSVSYNDWQAGQLAARHLFELGHRRFAVSDETNDPEWPIDSAWTQRRLGFEAELARLGGIIRPTWRVEMPRYRRSFDAHGTYHRQIAEWAAAGRMQQPTALFSFGNWRLNDFFEALNAASCRVPRDMSVVTVCASHEKVVVGGLHLTHVSVNLTTLVSRAFDAAEQLAATGRRSNAEPRLFSVPVLLAPAESTAGIK
jgi:DNA-binding transcriptional regulator YhcF (GntR family)